MRGLPYRDSIHNRYVIAEVGGGGCAPFWRIREWWTGAVVTLLNLHEPRRGYQFYFPEGPFVDALAHTLANVWDLAYRYGLTGDGRTLDYGDS